MTHYETLEINQQATSADIKQSYRRLAKKHHPDTQDGCEETFKQINEAYSTLSDDKKRKQYDFTLNSKNNPFDNFHNFHKHFKENLDIQRNVTVSLRDTYEGAKVFVEVYSNQIEELVVPKGLQSGTKIVFQGKGVKSKQTGRVGDLIFTIFVKNDDNIKKVDLLDLEIEQKVNVFELILGTTLDIKLWDNVIGKVKLGGGIDSSKRIRLKGKGLPNSRYNTSGDLYVKLIVETPKVDDLPNTLVDEINSYINGEQNGTKQDT